MCIRLAGYLRGVAGTVAVSKSEVRSAVHTDAWALEGERAEAGLERVCKYLRQSAMACSRGLAHSTYDRLEGLITLLFARLGFFRSLAFPALGWHGG